VPHRKVRFASAACVKALPPIGPSGLRSALA
jgi:hypothetical protein